MERSLSPIQQQRHEDAVVQRPISTASSSNESSSSAAASPNLPSDVTASTCPRRSTASDLSAATSVSTTSSAGSSSSAAGAARPRTHKLSNNSSSSRPSSVASNSSQTSNSHQGQLSLQPNLLSPTLASALGINIIASSSASSASSTAPPPKQRSVSRPATLTADAAAGGAGGWGRRPSLPNVPSMINRVSMISIASFESLPEGESVSFANSPLSSAMSDGESEPQTATSTRTASSAGPSRTLSPPPGSSSAHAASPSSSSGFSTLSSGRPSVLQRSSTDPNHLIASYEFLMKKRRNVAMELVDTERLFVASLKLINESYYQPLMALSKGAPASSVTSSSVSAPVLSRKALAEIFSNFPDILQLNSELLVRLDDRLSGRNRATPTSRPSSLAVASDVELSEAASASPWAAETDALGDILVPMAPFLKMYGLFVQNFSSALARIEAERKSNEAFNRFLRDTERATWGKASASGGFGFGLGFQAHLLTIVQRIPRYKMLVGDLVKFTPSNHRDYADLSKAYQVIEQVASYINENIRQHEMILVMIGLQRSLIGLPEPLVVPGRSLLKRGALLKACRRNLQYREFFLFSDCLVYASAASGSMGMDAWQALARGGGLYNVDAARPTSPTSPASPRHPLNPNERIPLSIDTSNYDASRTRTSSAESLGLRPLSLSLDGQQLQFRGKFALQDCTVVGVDGGNSNPALRHSFEIRTPNKSFAVYAETFEAKEAWLTAIRDAREDLMTARRTLQADEDSIEAKRDRRRTMYRVQLQPSQLQHIQLGQQQQRIDEQLLARRKSAASGRATSSSIPEGTAQTGEEDFASIADSSLQSESTVPASGSGASLATLLSSHTTTSAAAVPRAGLRVLEDYNAPVWVPDSRADKCICCTEAFGIWRRKHHCRLCGQVVCWACSTRSFLIARYDEGEGGEDDKPARACDSCYDSVFPAGEAEPHSPPPPLVHSAMPLSALEAYEQPLSPRSPNMPQLGDVEAPSPALSDDSSAAPRRPALAPVARPSSLGNELNGQSRSTSSSTLASSSDDAGSDDVSALPLSLAAQRRRSTPLSLYAAQRAPGPRIARATGAKPSLFSGNSLSPQVQAATSGSGTFRLCTPRLTTPEAELPPGGEAAANVDSYFSPGASSSHSSTSHDDDGLGELKANFARPHSKKKPLSAAARLSTFYNVPNAPPKR